MSSVELPFRNERTYFSGSDFQVFRLFFAFSCPPACAVSFECANICTSSCVVFLRLSSGLGYEVCKYGIRGSSACKSKWAFARWWFRDGELKHMKCNWRVGLMSNHFPEAWTPSLHPPRKIIPFYPSKWEWWIWKKDPNSKLPQKGRFQILIIDSTTPSPISVGKIEKNEFLNLGKTQKKSMAKSQKTQKIEIY